MAVATRNRSKSASISKSALDQVGSLLQDLSAKPKEEMSIREAIDQLREPIQAAMAKGYTYEDIVQILTESGISTTVTTVKRYISLGNPPRGKSAASKGRGKRTGEAQAVGSSGRDKSSASPLSSEAEEAPKATRGRKKASAAVEEPVAEPKKSNTKATRGRKKAI